MVDISIPEYDSSDSSDGCRMQADEENRRDAGRVRMVVVKAKDSILLKLYFLKIIFS